MRSYPRYRGRLLSPAFALVQLLTLMQKVFALVELIAIGYLIIVRSSDKQLQVFIHKN